MAYRLFTVYRNSAHTSVSFNIETTPEPTDSNIEVTSGSSSSAFKGYRSALYYSGTSGKITVGVFLVLTTGDTINYYSLGQSYPTPYDNGNGYYGFYAYHDNYANTYDVEDFGIIPTFTDRDEWLTYVQTPPAQTFTSNGGGATHIAKRTGKLKDLSSYTSDILIVSGGGGGGYLVGETAYDGADAGGISGSGSNSGNQSTGYAFGQGESGTNKSGGGGGFYGGYTN